MLPISDYVSLELTKHKSSYLINLNVTIHNLVDYLYIYIIIVAYDHKLINIDDNNNQSPKRCLSIFVHDRLQVCFSKTNSRFEVKDHLV